MGLWGSLVRIEKKGGKEALLMALFWVLAAEDSFLNKSRPWH